MSIPDSSGREVVLGSRRPLVVGLHEVHEAGGRELLEYWIPAEELDDFNDHILGVIEVVAGYSGQPPRRIR
jgi:hypothetical protein